MKKQQFIYIVCLAALVSGCNIYKPYSRPEMDTKGLYRDPVSATDTLVSDTTNMATCRGAKYSPIRSSSP